MKLPLSSIVKDQLPEHIRENYEVFSAFMEAYYEWMEQQNSVSGADKGLINLKDADNTIDSFIKYIIAEISTIQNHDIAVDKRLFIKHVHDLFNAKGSEKAFKLFFQLIYGIKAEVFYPSENILRSSDGQYYKQNVLTLELIDGNVSDLLNSYLIGQESNASVAIETVESIQLLYDGYVHKATINNSSLNGIFIPNEIVIANKDTDKEVSFYIKGTLSKINIINPGQYYNEGQEILINSTTGTGAKAIISKVSAATLIKLNATYSKSGTTVTVDLGNDYHKFKIDDYAYLEFNSGIKTGVYRITNIVDPFKFQFSSSPSETIVSDNVNVYDAKTYGKILEVKILDHGINYQDATFTII